MTAQLTVTPRDAVVESDPRSDNRWRSLVEGSAGSLFTSPPWLRAVASTYGLTPRCRMLIRDGVECAGLAYAVVEDLRGRRVVSLPFSDWSDPVGCDTSTWSLLGEGLVDTGGPVRMRVRDAEAPRMDRCLEHRGEVAWHASTVGGADVRSSSAKRNVAKAEREGVRVEADTGVAALADYHRLHVSRRKHRYRMLAQPLEFFENLYTEFAPGDGIVTLLVRWEDRVIGGGVFLVWGDELYYKFGASSEEHLVLRPNDAMFDAALRWAHDRGLRRVDWGCSDLDQPGLVAFKRKWADLEGHITVLGAGRPDPQRSGEMDTVLHGLTDLLTDSRVPDDVSARAGSLLYRYFC